MVECVCFRISHGCHIVHDRQRGRAGLSRHYPLCAESYSKCYCERVQVMHGHHDFLSPKITETTAEGNSC